MIPLWISASLPVVAEVRVRVPVGRAAVRRPARVADAGRRLAGSGRAGRGRRSSTPSLPARLRVRARRRRRPRRRRPSRTRGTPGVSGHRRARRSRSVGPTYPTIPHIRVILSGGAAMHDRCPARGRDQGARRPHYASAVVSERTTGSPATAPARSSRSSARAWAELAPGTPQPLRAGRAAPPGRARRAARRARGERGLPAAEPAAEPLRDRRPAAARARRARSSAPAPQTTPFVIGVAGSVAVGKSTVARLLRELLARWDDTPKVELVPTDGFLLPNAELERRGILRPEGVPGVVRPARRCCASSPR